TVTVGSKTITLDTIEDVTIGDTGSSLAFNAKGEDVELRPGKIIVHFSDGSTRAFKTAGSITLTLGDKDGTQGRIVNDTSGLFNDGLSGLATLATRLESQGPLAQSIPGISDNTVTVLPGKVITGGDVSLGRAMGLGQVLAELRAQIIKQQTNSNS